MILIDLGTGANTESGDTLYAAFGKINTNSNNLQNVDNTSDLNKPISTATQNALNLKANLASPTFTGTVNGITKSMVGLNNVDNTTDISKPISTLTQTALDLKAPLASPTITGTLTTVNDAYVNGVEIGKGGGNVSTNTKIGFSALNSNGAGANNTASGFAAMNQNINGNFNSALGSNSLLENEYGINNTAVGTSALQNSMFDNNTAIGAFSGSTITNLSNTTSIGANAQATLSNQVVIGDANVTTTILRGAVTANKDATFNSVDIGKGGGNISTNTKVGFASLNLNTTGYNNTVLGYGSATSNTTGYSNTSVGANSLLSNQFGVNNTAIGNTALQNSTGDNNTALGNRANFDNTIFVNTTCLGFNAQPTASDQVVLGNTSVNALKCNVQTITSLSDERDKTDIVEIIEGLEFINKLKPVTFTWNQRDEGRVGIKSAGFIAQDLLELQNDSLIGENLDLVSDLDPEQLEARYGNLLPVMIKAIQELTARINVLEGN